MKRNLYLDDDDVDVLGAAAAAATVRLNFIYWFNYATFFFSRLSTVDFAFFAVIKRRTFF